MILKNVNIIIPYGSIVYMVDPNNKNRHIPVHVDQEKEVLLDELVIEDHYDSIKKKEIR